MGPHEPMGAATDARRYSAFISYSHADADFARRLHRKLETYRLPHKALVRASRGALVGGRLKPIFRDTDELSASSDLTQAVREALASSDHLIVVCSPKAVASPWVAREIELFRELHGDAGIVPALIAGEPDEAFPPALRGPAGLEPLAADFRGDASTRRLGLLKLVAVLAGVRLDELIQRDAQRRMRSVMVAAAASAAGVAVVAGLGAAAFDARRQAEAQQARAGTLGDFMISDLRKGLEGAGRHDLLAQVDQAAMKALSTDISRLTPDQLLQRATLLQGMAKDSEKKGDLKAAHAAADAALKTTTALLAAKPNDPKRLFAHAQSEYWVGFINMREGNAVAARAGWEAYARVADRLVATDPNNDDWRMEGVSAAEDLGILALRQAGDPARAEGYFRTSLGQLETIAAHKPGDTEIQDQRANALAWLGDSQRLQRHMDEALASREAQRSILEARLAKSPRNIEVQAHLLSYDLAVARIAAERGETARALSLLKAGRQKAVALQAQDPDNKDFAKQARMFELFEARIWLRLPAARRPARPEIASVLGTCDPLGPGAVNQEISDFCGVLLARFRAERGDASGAEAALAPVRQHAAQRHEVLTARWGLDLAAEARPVELTGGGAR